MKTRSIALIIIGIVFVGSFSFVYSLTYDCSLERKINILNCNETVNGPSYIQEITTLSIESNDTTIVIDVEIADEFQEQIKGLMFRDSLDWNEGMLFTYESEKKRAIWMKNTLIPLDLLFIDEDFRIIDIKENVQPCVSKSCPNYVSEIPSKYILEVNAGFTDMNNIRIGDSVTWNITT